VIVVMCVALGWTDDAIHDFAEEEIIRFSVECV